MGQFQSSIPRVDEENIKKEVKRFPVVLYTKPRCDYCTKAKQLLDDERIEYKEHDLDAHQVYIPKFINALNSNFAWILYYAVQT